MHSTDEMPKNSNTFLFLFSHETKGWTREQPYSSGIRGSLSDEHIPYIFGYPVLSSVQNKDSQIYTGFNNEDKGIARVMMKYISNFVKSGDPARPHAMSTETTIEDRFHGTPWPQYTPETREVYLEITDRPRVKNYLRNSFVGFWSSFIPQLNRGSKEVPEEHNFLPDHFNKHSFYGVVRPYSSFHNDPFPPPPLPPTVFPRDLKRSTTTAASPMEVAQKPSTRDKNAVDVKHSENYSLVITVAVGIGLLVLNLCVYAIMFRKCCERKRKSKKHLKYQSYTTGHSDVSYLPANSLGQQLPPPPPALAARLSTDDTSHANNFTAFDAGLNSMRNSFISHHHERANPPCSSFNATNNNEMLTNGAGANQQYRGNTHEQEPLLAGANSKSPTPGLVGVRAGISPTCPRHGRAAQILLASRANSVGSTTAYTMGQAPSATLEEVQV